MGKEYGTSITIISPKDIQTCVAHIFKIASFQDSTFLPQNRTY